MNTRAWKVKRDVLSVGNLNLLGRQVLVERIHRQQDNPWDIQVLDNPLSDAGFSTSTSTYEKRP